MRKTYLQKFLSEKRKKSRGKYKKSNIYKKKDKNGY